MSMDQEALTLVRTISAQGDAEPAVLALDVHRLAAILLGQAPRSSEDPRLHAALQFHHEALKLEARDWVRPAPRVKVTRGTVLTAVRLVYCWRALGAAAESAAQELLRLAARHCGESREHHLLPFWTELNRGECSENLRAHLLGPGARGSFQTGPYSEDVFPFRVFPAERLCGDPHRKLVPEADLDPVLEDLLVNLALLEP